MIPKTDPVKQFHKHQAQWKKDDFLNRSNAKNKPLKKQVIDDPSAKIIPERPRHNLASLRPTYGKYFIVKEIECY